MSEQERVRVVDFFVRVMGGTQSKKRSHYVLSEGEEKGGFGLIFRGRQLLETEGVEVFVKRG